MKRIALIVGLLLPLWIAVAEGQFSFQPISATLSPQGARSSLTFTVRNSSDSPMAVRLQMLTRELLSDGSERREPVDDRLFALFPARVVLEPGQSRNVRLNWRGPTSLDRERAYRVLAEQLPVDFSGDEPEASGGQLEIAFRYFGALYVTPSGAEPNVRATAERIDGDIRIVVHNAGTRHVVIRSPEVTLTAGSGSNRVEHTVQAEELEWIAGKNLLAGAQLMQRIESPAGFPPGQVAVDFSFERQQ